MDKIGVKIGLNGRVQSPRSPSVMALVGGGIKNASEWG